MIARLVVAELLEAWRIWLGAFVVAAFSALIALVCAGDFSTAAVTPSSGNPGGLINHALIVGLINIPVVVGALSVLMTYSIRLQRVRHALWQFAGMAPRQIRRVVLLQVTVLGVMAFAVALAFAPLVVRTLLNGLVSASGVSSTPYPRIVLSPGPVLVAFVLFLAVVVLSGWGAARTASGTPALVAVRLPEQQGSAISRRRLRIGFVVLGIAIVEWLAAQVTRNGFLDFGTLVFIVAFLVLSPVVSERVMTWWTSLVRSQGSVWFISREFARYNVTRSHAGITLMVVAIGLAQFIGYIGLFADPQYIAIGLAIFATPIILVLIAGAATIFMTVLDRRRETALLVVAGGTYRQALRAGVLEAVIFVATAALISVVLAIPLMLRPQTDGQWWTALAPVPFVLVIGMGLMLVATLSPVLQARKGSLAGELARGAL